MVLRMDGESIVKKGLVSIVIPVHNRKKLIKCLKAIESQTYKDIEVILIEFKGFPAEKRNIGFKASEGGYVFFLDEDEYISPTVIEECVKLASSGYGIVSVPVKKVVPPRYIARCISIVRESTYKSMFFRRDVLERIGLFDPSYVLCDDIEIRLRALRSGFRMAQIENGWMLHDEDVSLKDIIKKVIIARKSFRKLRLKYGSSIYADVIKASYHRRRIFKELVRKPMYIIGVLLIMFMRFLARRLP